VEHFSTCPKTTWNISVPVLRQRFWGSCLGPLVYFLPIGSCTSRAFSFVSFILIWKINWRLNLANRYLNVRIYPFYHIILYVFLVYSFFTLNGQSVFSGYITHECAINKNINSYFLAFSNSLSHMVSMQFLISFCSFHSNFISCVVTKHILNLCTE
jgi:hypothetical protein